MTEVNEDILKNHKPFSDIIEAELKTIVTSRPLNLYKMLRYHLGFQKISGETCQKSHGKLIRPILCLLCCQATEGEFSQVIPAAASLELIHNFSLIHDDIQDNSHKRRQRPTVWKLWGKEHAINAGDAMFAMSYLELLKLQDNNTSDKKIVRSIRLLSEACLNICEGQYLDMLYESNCNISTENYLTMIMKKTAGLIAACTALGASFGTEDDEVINYFYMFGRDLGMAYQIADDILGIWGAEAKTGKSAKIDIFKKKKTFPVVYSLNNSTGPDQKELKQFYSHKNTESHDVIRIVEILNTLGAQAYSQKIARQYYKKALSRLETIDIEQSRRAPIISMVNLLMGRDC